MLQMDQYLSIILLPDAINFQKQYMCWSNFLSPAEIWPILEPTISFVMVTLVPKLL